MSIESKNVSVIDPESPQNQPQWLVVITAFLLVGVIGWCDYQTGWEYSLLVFYALPIVYVGWLTNSQLGFMFALICAATWWGVYLESNPYQSNLGFAMAVLGRLFYFLMLVLAVAAIKSQQASVQARIDRLELTQKLERDILRVSEREQQRIGRDLHDSLGPHLAAIGYAASFLSNELQQLNPAQAAKAEHIHGMLIDATTLLRDLVQGIYPEQLDSFSLSIALEDLANTTSRLSGISVSYCETGTSLVKDTENAMHLYRIVQEAVNNAAKHGRANKVTIVLNNIDRSLRLTINDNGKGMLISQNGTRGMGLHSMRYRARALGGELRIESIADQGTTVCCEIPSYYCS